MATGRTFRARQLDVQRAMEIVRDESLLDGADGFPAREVVHNHAELDAENEKPQMIKQAKGGKEIPIPITLKVETYDVDYLPTFQERNTYIRGRGGSGYRDPTFVEYDLDSEDFEWLTTVNIDGQERLSPEKFEMMLWKLDIANAEATDHVFSFQGSAAAERRTVQACATTDHLQKQDALQMLQDTCPARNKIVEAVYLYWKEKRARLGRPLLRRLQAPTPLNNQDPYKVFRSRERTNRPQTRRRRENNPDSLEKLGMISDNIKMAMKLFELVIRRERKKRDLVYVNIDTQQLHISQRHEPKSKQEQIENEYLHSLKSKSAKRPIGFEDLPEAAPGGVTNSLLEFKKNGKKKRRLGEEPILNAVAQIEPSPNPPEEKLPCTWLPSEELRGIFSKRGISIADGQYRLGRSSKVVVDRCNPFTLEPLGTEESIDPIHKVLNERGECPYASWSGKLDLADKAVAKLEGKVDIVVKTEH